MSVLRVSKLERRKWKLKIPLRPGETVDVMKYGNVGMWEYGNMGIWEYGNMGIWEYGNMGQLVVEREKTEDGRGGQSSQCQYFTMSKIRYFMHAHQWWNTPA